MIFGIKTKKDKKIEELENENEQLKEKVEDYKEKIEELRKNGNLALQDNDELMDDNKKLRKEIKNLEHDCEIFLKKTKEKEEILKQNIQVKEYARRKAVSSVGGLRSSVARAINAKNEMNKTLVETEKRELHLLKVFFNEIKNDKHTQDYFRQELKVLKEKYDKEVVINVSSNSKSFTNVECRGSNITNKR